MRAPRSHPPAPVHATPPPVASRLPNPRPPRTTWTCVTSAAILTETFDVSGPGPELLELDLDRAGSLKVRDPRSVRTILRRLESPGAPRDQRGEVAVAVGA